MAQTKEAVTSIVKTPWHILIGFLSRLFFVAFLPIGLFMIIKAVVFKIRGVEVAEKLKSYALVDPEMVGKKFFHQGHTWAMATETGTVTVGLDNFAQKVLGAIDNLELPKAGRLLKQGRIAWRLHRGNRVLPQISPIDGTIVEVNGDLQKDPTLANQSPYEKGWVLKVKPARLKENIRNLLQGQLAEKWMELAKSQLAARFPQSLGPVYQDGGELIDGVGNTLTDEEWEIVKREFFL
ncbi:MAG: glycine cleavage system protein H [Gemmatimonadota bacterium]|nr:MAG: glycine cleavage system protein H [Gemmatimonadota bacterium]